MDDSGVSQRRHRQQKATLGEGDGAVPDVSPGVPQLGIRVPGRASQTSGGRRPVISQIIEMDAAPYSCL